MFGNKPKIPIIEREDEVIDWFLACDEKTSDFRNNFAALLPNLKSDIQVTLKENPTSTKLQEIIKKFQTFYGEIALPQAAKRHQNKGPIDGESQSDYINILVMESMIAVKVRVLGYFLLKKHNIQPQ